MQQRGYVGVSSQFLRKDHYIKSCQVMLKRKVIMKQMVEFIQSVYKHWNRFSSKCMALGKASMTESDSFGWVKEFLDNRVFSVFSKVMTFQETQLKKVIEEGRQIEQSSDGILRHLHNFTSLQEDYKRTVQALKELLDKQENPDTKIPGDNSIVLFSEKTQQKRVYYLEQKIAQADRHIGSCSSQQNRLELQRAEFIEEAYQFRYLLCTSRAVILLRFKEICSHTAQGFIIAFGALRQNLKGLKNNRQSLPFCLQTSRSVIVLDHKSEPSARITTQENYGQQLIVFMEYLKELLKTLLSFSHQLKKEIDGIELVLMDSIIKSFHMSQSCFEDVTVLLGSLKSVLMRMENVTQQVSLKEQQINILSKNLQKRAQIELSLKKTNKRLNKSTDKACPQKVDPITESDAMDRLVNSIFEAFLEESDAFVVQAETRKLEIETISSISHQASLDSGVSFLTEKSVDQKQLVMKPVEQIWLWEDWKEEESFKLPLVALKNLKKIVSLLKSYDNDTASVPLLSYECCFVPLNITGTLQIRSTVARFISSTYVGRVAYCQIEKSCVKVIRSKDVLYLVSRKGLLCFQQLADPHKVNSIILQKMSKSTFSQLQSRISKNFNNYPAGFICLQEQQEFQSIGRILKLKTLLPTFEHFQKISDVSLVDVTLVTFFRECLSDTNITINGQKYQNLFVYSFLKSNTQVVQSKWTPQPPTYFTGIPGTPINSDLTHSEKTLQYQWMPGVQTTYLPHVVKCKSFLKLFWVDKHRLVLLIRTNHTNASLGNHAIIQTAMQITEHNRNVKLEFSKRITLSTGRSMQEQLVELVSQQIKDFVRHLTNSVLSKLNQNQAKVDTFCTPLTPDPFPPQDKPSELGSPQRFLAVFTVCFLLLWVFAKIT